MRLKFVTLLWRTTNWILLRVIVHDLVCIIRVSGLYHRVRRRRPCKTPEVIFVSELVEKRPVVSCQKKSSNLFYINARNVIKISHDSRTNIPDKFNASKGRPKESISSPPTTHTNPWQEENCWPWLTHHTQETLICVDLYSIYMSQKYVCANSILKLASLSIALFPRT